MYVTPTKEANHVECKAELTISHHYESSKSDSTESSPTLYESAVLLKPSAGTLVTTDYNVAMDCNEEELLYSVDINDREVSTCYTKCSSYVDSVEETGLNPNNIFAVAERATQQSTDFKELSRDVKVFVSDDDGTSCNEATFGILSSDRRNFSYSDYSFRAKIVGNSALTDAYYESDRPHKPQDDHLKLPYPSSSNGPVKEPVTGSEAVNVYQPSKNTTANALQGYTKLVYPVLVGNSVKVYPTNLFALLPQHDKFLVKERSHDPTKAFTRAKLVLKSCLTEAKENDTNHASSMVLPDKVENDNSENNDVISAYYRQNCNSPGRILYTRDRRFNGRTKYPLPNGRAVSNKIGKGGNGFVFTMYHERKQYAVKKTVYRPNEINVHSALKQNNILPLLAVLMGEKHERHHGKFYCFHFMPQMDCDLRQILSAKDIGCLKYFYRNCSKDPTRWEKGFNNIKFVLTETLEGLAYLHNSGYVHRDVKASNIMIKMRCHCRPLECSCSSRFQVKLGDFDSAGTVPGLGITEPTDQVIKFASILPLGTPGYRAPEVSMHTVLSGPYETLYTTAVDMWSFGCPCLNICIGKTAALKQREEASLLLSKTHICSTELWEKTTKINELKRTKPFCNEPELIRLVGSCLQVNSANRPTAKDTIKMFH